jgi:acetoin utilization protein AcuB
MKVAEIMKKTVVTVNKDATMKKCGELIEKHNVNGLPVMDGDQLVGIITRDDIFKGILPKYSDIYMDERYLADFESIEERLYKLSELKVKDLMATTPLTIGQDTPLVKAGSLMVLRGIRQLPVVENGKLVGIITLSAICRNFIERAK